MTYSWYKRFNIFIESLVKKSGGVSRLHNMNGAAANGRERGVPSCWGSQEAKSRFPETHVLDWMFPKIVGKPPKIIPCLIGFSIIHHPFWGIPLFFGNTQLDLTVPGSNQNMKICRITTQDVFYLGHPLPSSWEVCVFFYYWWKVGV